MTRVKTKKPSYLATKRNNFNKKQDKINKKGLEINPKSKKAKMEKLSKKDTIEKKENPNNDNIKSVKKEKKKQNINKNVEKSNSKQDSKQIRGKELSRKAKKKLAAIVTSPKDPKVLQAEINNLLIEKNECTLFVKFTKETGMTDREILIKAFAEKVKAIRPHRKFKNINYVEFETKEQLEEMKPQIEKMQTSGEKAIVDYMGDKGKVNFSQKHKIDTTRLFLDGLPEGTKTHVVRKLFEKCSEVRIRKCKRENKSLGFVSFKNESDAKAAFVASQNMKIGGADVTVLFSKLKKNEDIVKSDKRPRDKENQVNGSPPKKQKIDKKEEQKKVEKKKMEEKKTEAMDEEETEEAENDDDAEGDDKKSEESKVDDKNKDDNAEESDDDDDEESDDE